MNFIYTGLLLLLSLVSSSMIRLVTGEFSELHIPIRFNKNNMYFQMENHKFVLDKEDQLTMKDGDCVTTVDLAAPNAKELEAKKAYRQVTRICTSWYTKAAKVNTNSTVKK
ncbi:hypothetical protein KSF78_0009380 [Schistosoma japonicum]|nr:hypothetical protein KSF78_0009380 [Schistosoma japonicum]